MSGVFYGFGALNELLAGRPFRIAERLVRTVNWACCGRTSRGAYCNHHVSNRCAANIIAGRLRETAQRSRRVNQAEGPGEG